MLKFKGVPLVDSNFINSHIKYKVINNVEEFDEDCRCIVVRSLNPDYYLLFNLIEFIITENGSCLSHLAIIALEYNIPIFLCSNIISEIPLEGRLSIKGETIEIEA